MRTFVSVCVLLFLVSACAAEEEEGGYDLEGFRALTAEDLVHKSFRFGSDAALFELDDPRFGQSSTLIVGEVYGTAAGFALTTEDGSLQGGALYLGSCLFQTTFIGLALQEPEIGLLSDDFFYCGVDDEGRLGLLDEDEELLIVSEVPTEADPDFDLGLSLSTEAVVEPRFDPATRPETGSATLQLFGNVLSYTLSIENLSAGDEVRDGRIHQGGASENGEIVLTLFGSPVQPVRQVGAPFIEGTSITASIFVTPDEVMALTGPGASNYLQIASVQEPGGLLRGQLGSATVGPDGGVFGFPNGVILDVPPGALGEAVDISVKDVPMDEVRAIFDARRISVRAKRRMVGAFRIEPVVAFRDVVAVTLPVDPPLPGELWRQVDIDRATREIWPSPTDLRYFAERGVVEMKLPPATGDKRLSGDKPARKQASGGTEHGAEGHQWDLEDVEEAERQNWLEQRCKIQPQLEACEALDPLQPACCLLRNIPLTCECCRQSDFRAQSSATESSQSRGTETCEIFTDTAVVEYYDCVGLDGLPPDPESHAMGGISEHCPEDIELELDIITASHELFVCETQQYAARIRGVLPDGTEVIPWRSFDPLWETGDPMVAHFIENPETRVFDGTLEAIGEGETEAWAYTGIPEQPYSDTSEVEVRSHISEFTLTPQALPLVVEQRELVSATLVKYDDTPLDASSVVWDSADDKVAFAAPEVTSVTRVEGVGRGCTEIEATYEYMECEHVTETVQVCVDCPIVTLTLSPTSGNVAIDGSMEITAEASTSEGPVDISGVTWITSDSATVERSPEVGPSTSAFGRGPGQATITAVYRDDCNLRSADSVVYVCPHIAFRPASATVNVDDWVPLDLVALNHAGEPMAGDFSNATFDVNPDDVAEIALGVDQRRLLVKGLSPGTATVRATNDGGCGTQFAEATIVVEDNSVTGTWNVKVVGGEQTCSIDGDDFFDSIESGADGELIDLVQTGGSLSARYQAYPAATPYTGTISATGDPLRPYRVNLSVDSSNTIDCILFFQTNGGELHYGQPICPENTAEQQWTCQATSCSEYEGITGYMLPGNAGFVGESSWEFDGRGNATLVEPPYEPVVFENVPIDCTGEARLIACREGGSPQLQRFLGECTSPVDAARVCVERVGREPAGAECLPGTGDDDMIACLYCE